MRGRHIEGPISLVAEAVHVIVSVSRRRGPVRATTYDVHVRFSLRLNVPFYSILTGDPAKSRKPSH